MAWESPPALAQVQLEEADRVLARDSLKPLNKASLSPHDFAGLGLVGCHDAEA